MKSFLVFLDVIRFGATILSAPFSDHEDFQALLLDNSEDEVYDSDPGIIATYERSANETSEISAQSDEVKNDDDGDVSAPEISVQVAEDKKGDNSCNVDDDNVNAKERNRPVFGKKYCNN